MTARDRRYISTLEPVTAALATALVQLVPITIPGRTIFIYQAHRTLEEQNELYAKGRTAPGDIVTNVRGGDSWHNCHRAIDVAFNPVGALTAFHPYHPWERLGIIGEALGFVWGGRWKMKDLGHFEFHGPYDSARKAYEATGDRHD